MLETWPDTDAPPADLHEHAKQLAAEFRAELQETIACTESNNLQRWPIRDRVPIQQWSKGRVTLAGDAAHPPSPYAAYGAGISICDGYFLGQCLAGLDLKDTSAVENALKVYESKRVAHTSEQVQLAYTFGQMFHDTYSVLRQIRAC